MARSITLPARGAVMLLLAAAAAHWPAISWARGPLTLDVMARVRGFSGPQKIGTWTADSNYQGQPNGVSARFEFHKDFTFLDTYYDFDYVQVIRDLSAGYKPLFPKGAPAIDPQSGNVSGANEDNYPYYYHFTKEWQGNLFNGGPIRKDGEWTLFIDFPHHNKGEFLDFTNMLVVRDHNSVKFKGETKFGLLTAFDWRYDGDNASAGVSTIGAARPVDAALAKLVDDAMANEWQNAFKGWSSRRTFTLIPAPGSVALLFLGGILCRRRRSA